MGACCADSYEVTPPGRSRASSTARQADESIQRQQARVGLPVSQTQRAVPSTSSLATGQDRSHRTGTAPATQLCENGATYRCKSQDAALGWLSGKSSHNGVSRDRYGADFSYGRRVELGYARVSTAKQDLERQIDALTAVGIARERIYLDNKSGVAVDRPGLRAVLRFARRGDVIVVHTLDRLGRTVRDTVNLIHELTERGVGVRNLADPIKVDSADSADPMRQLAVVLLALFAQMDRIYTCERAAHARAVAAAHGRQVGRPSLLDPAVLAYAVQLRDAGHTMTQIVAKTGMTRSSLYRYLPPRPPPLLTAAEPTQEGAVAPTAETTRVPVGA